MPAPPPDAVPLVFHRQPPAGMLDRRRALALMAASLALAHAGCTRAPPQQVYSHVLPPEAGIAGEPLFYASAWLRQGHAQGVLLGTREGRPIKVEGNPAHPSSLGGSDAFMQASILQLWDPDRSPAVMQRLGDGPAQGVSSWPAFEAEWRQRARVLDERAGEGLALLTGPLTSPTLRAQLAALQRRWPQAQLFRHAPLDEGAAGVRRAFGRDLQPLWQLDRAGCVLALGGDPFSDGPGALRLAADWARERAAGRAPRLLAVEVAPGLFGARADLRIALAPDHVEGLLWRLAAQLDGAVPAPPPHALPPAAAAFEAQALQALRAAGPGALLLPGAALSAAAQALAHAINQRRGARGVSWIPTTEEREGRGTLAALAQALDAGAVQTLLLLDTNPAFDAPAELELPRRLARAAWSAHLGLYRDESARLCRWHLPLSHPYERWDDALAHEGSATLLQPALQPLYDGRSAIEWLALLLDDPQRDGHALLRRQWRARMRRGDFEAFWRESLRRGVVPDSAPTPRRAPPATLPEPPALPPVADEAPLVAVCAASPSVLDGSLANNAWLQELPQPFTKLTWDNAAHLGPATARRLGLHRGDVVELSRGAHRLRAPVWVLDGHAEGVLTLPLGYGRRAAGRVGDGVGFDARALQPAEGGAFAVQARRSGGRVEFAVTQHAMDQHGRALARVLRPGQALAPEPAPPSLYAPPPRAAGAHAWAMVIDLDACIGCNACTAACQAENNIPVVGREQVRRGREMHWIRVDRYAGPGGASVFQPVPCMHCEQAPCELVCPVGATMHDAEGLNVQVYNRCIGTRFCSNNCPYKVRRFNFLQYADLHTETLKAQRNPEVTVRQRGVMEKCNYCLQRIARARHHEDASGTPLREGDVLTACQAACPTQAIHFGDLADPASALHALKASPRHYALLGELGTRPRTTYLARVAGEAP